MKRELAIVGPYRSLLATAMVARLPISMAAVGLLTVGLARGFGSGLAGTAVGLWTACVAVSMPVWGRRTQVRGPRLVLGECLAGQVLGCLGLALSGSHPPAYLAASVILGATTPPLAAMMRATWNRVFSEDPDASGRMATVETMVGEILHIAGRIVVAALSALAVWLIPVVYLALIVAGSLRLRRDPRIAPPLALRPAGRRAGPGMWSRTTVAWAAVLLSMAVSHGAAATAMVVGASPGGGWRGAATMAVWGLGSLLGGAWTLKRATLPGPVATVLAGQAVFAAGASTLGLVGAPLAAVWALVLVLGAPISPAISAAFRAVRGAVPAEHEVQLFSTYTALNFLGFSLGAAAAGWIAESSGTDAAAWYAAAGISLLAVVPSILAPKVAMGESPATLTGR